MRPADLVSDPLAWLAWGLRGLAAEAARLGALPAWMLLMLVALGLAVAALGARWRRPLAVVGGTGAGALGGAALAGALGLSAPLLAGLGAAALGGLSLAFPACFPFAAGALPGALLGARVEVGGVRILGAAIGLFLAGGLGLMGARLVAASTAGILGAGIAAAGLAGLAAQRPELAVLARHPTLLAAGGVVVAVAGAAFQMGWAWEPGARRGRAGSRPAGADGEAPDDQPAPTRAG